MTTTRVDRLYDLIVTADLTADELDTLNAQLIELQEMMAQKEENQRQEYPEDELRRDFQWSTHPLTRDFGSAL